MKNPFKFLISLFAVSAVLCGCGSQKQTEVSSGSGIAEIEYIPVTETFSAQTEKEPETESKTEIFSGFEMTAKNHSVGNTPSSLNQNGILYCDDEKMLFNDADGNLILQQGEQRKTLADLVNAKCINVIDDNVYFIDPTDENRVYIYDLSNNICEKYIDDHVSFLMIVDEIAFYEDENHQLIFFRNGSTKVISSQQVLWVEVFDDNIIYTELEASNSTVKAFNISTNESTIILDYGFSPYVFGERLYYQAKDGKIRYLNLLNGKSEDFSSEWGQQFCFVQDKFYFLNSKGINSNSGIVYNSEDENFSVMSAFVCNNELYFTEGNGEDNYLYRLNVGTKEKELIE